MKNEHEFIGSSKTKNVQIAPEVQKNELPKSYGDTKIVALVKDPLWVHAYWEISEKKVNDLKSMLGDTYESSTIILRVYDITGIDFNGDNAASYFDISVNQATSWYINVGNPNREYVIDLGLLTPAGQFILIARSNVVKTPRNTISNNVDEKWGIVEENYAEILRMSGSGQIGKASADIMSEITKRLFSDMNFSSGTLSSGSSDTVQGKKIKEEDGFYFKVATELIIYGETMPDADVTVGGQKIQLKEDGSFSLRMELPDGNHEFDIKAVSANKKHKRGADITVNKNTK